MIEIRPFRRDDLLRIKTHARYGDLAELAHFALGNAALDDGFYRVAWTAEADGRPIACCGIRRGLAWAFISPEMTTRQALRVSFRVRQVLREHSSLIGPVIARIDPDFALALRWAKLLGFARVEGTDKWVYDDQL